METNSYNDLEIQIFDSIDFLDIQEFIQSVKYEPVYETFPKNQKCCANYKSGLQLVRCTSRVLDNPSWPSSQRNKFFDNNKKESSQLRMKKYCRFHFLHYIVFNTKYKAICREENLIKEKTFTSLSILSDLKKKCAHYRRAFTRVFFQPRGQLETFHCTVDNGHLAVIDRLERDSQLLREEANLLNIPSKKRKNDIIIDPIFKATQDLEISNIQKKIIEEKQIILKRKSITNKVN